MPEVPGEKGRWSGGTRGGAMMCRWGGCSRVPGFFHLRRRSGVVPFTATALCLPVTVGHRSMMPFSICPGPAPNLCLQSHGIWRLPYRQSDGLRKGKSRAHPHNLPDAYNFDRRLDRWSGRTPWPDFFLVKKSRARVVGVSVRDRRRPWCPSPPAE